MIVLCLVAVFCGIRYSMKHGYLTNSIARNVEEESVTIIIKGIGNYIGTITSEFEIFDPEENK